MDSLFILARKNAANKLGAGERHYCDAYERMLTRTSIKAMLEIGVQSGGSLRMWRAWLEPGTVIVGVDNAPTAADRAPGFPVLIGDQSDPRFLATVAARGPYDLIVDDGGHRSRQRAASFTHLWPSVTPGGWYVVEDTHTCYWPEFDDGDTWTFTERAKLLIDDINKWAIQHARAAGHKAGFVRLSDVAEMYVVSGMVFVRKEANR